MESIFVLTPIVVNMARVLLGTLEVIWPLRTRHVSVKILGSVNDAIKLFPSLLLLQIHQRTISVVDVPAAPIPFWAEMRMDILVDQELNGSKLQMDTTN